MEKQNNPSHDERPFILPSGTIEDSDEKSEVPLGSGIITSLLGKGGMANVYEIWNKDLEIHRAVKLIHPTCSELDRERFDTEIKITAKLHHPSIVEIHGIGKWNGLSYLEMEKIDGITLKDMIDKRGALPVAICTAIGIMISDALEYAHNQEYVIYGTKYQGIIHRDLKPSNIMLCKNGMVKLMDFGIARPTDASFHTMDGTVVGTIHYLPPEQLKGGALNVTTDLYALAATLYETLTGLKAFPEKNLSKLMNDKSKNSFKPLGRFNISIPGKLKRIIHKCMHHNSEKRVSTAHELHEKLKKIHYSITNDEPNQLIKKLVNTCDYEKIIVTPRKRTPKILSTLLILMIIGAGIVLLFRKSLFVHPYFKSVKNGHTTPAVLNNQKPIRSPFVKQVTTPLTYPLMVDSGGTASQIKVARPVENKTYADTLHEIYGNNNLPEIMHRALVEKKYEDILRAFMLLKDSEQTEKINKLHYFKALKELKQGKNFLDYLAANTIDDGEYYLEKAKMVYQANDVAQAESLLTLALQKPSDLMERKSFKQEVFYNQALCATIRFNDAPSEDTYKNALWFWHQLKTEMKNNQEHPFYQAALSEMQNIGTTYRNSKKE